MRAIALAVCGVLVLAVEPAAAALVTTAVPGGHAATTGGERLVAKKRRRKKKRSKSKPKPKPKPKLAPVQPPQPQLPALPPPPPLPEGGQAVCVLPLQALDVTDEITGAVEQTLYAEVEESEGLTAVSPRDVLNDLGNYGFDPAVCAGDVGCVAKAGRYARCHLAIEPRVAAIGGTVSISMRLVDTQSGLEVGRVADPISEPPQERSQELHRLMVQLLAPDTYVGSLDIRSAQEGAEVYLDDRLVGTTPLDEPISGLTAGPHILRVSKPGFSDVNQFVDVVYKRNSTIIVDLENATISGLIVEQVSTTGFGTLYVVSNEPHVTIRVDGEPKGATPTGPIKKVEAGRRRLSLRKPGFAPFAGEIEVLADRRTELAIAVDESGMALVASRTAALDAGLPSWDELVGIARQPLAPEAKGAIAWSPGWRFWTGVGAGGAALASFAVAGVAGAQVQDAEADAEELLQQFDGIPDPDDSVCTELKLDNTCKHGALYRVDRRGREWSNVHVATLIGGAVLAAVGAGFVIWDMVGEPVAKTRTEVLGFELVPLPGGGQVVVSGTF